MPEIKESPSLATNPVGTGIDSRGAVPPTTGSPVFQKSVTAKYVNKNWVITIMDNAGRDELTPREANLLIKNLTISLRRRYRQLRVMSFKTK